ncbi:MAG: D-glycerate dehydrogenase [Candidatus Omnitrophota bacterium]|jgi:lactate dehydrogenase-like 2-hydroxyacid dehydrogenase|nr:MAG: D-glycerate dehydrogenase [Candidatus Omnitrophota bacterium]
MAPNVYITRKIPQPALDRLREAGIQFDVYPHDEVIPHDVLLEQVAGRDGILCILTDTIDEEVLHCAGRAKIFANYAVGYNNIDVEAATRRGIAVTNTPGVLTDATADLAWTLLFAAARNVIESDAYLRAGKFVGWGPLHFLGQDVAGKTLGVIGLGRIGKAFVQRGAAFRMNILYHSRQRDEVFEQSYPHEIKYVELHELLERSDFVSIHVPLTPETTHLIGKRELERMQSHAILINTARGPIVDEQALVDALKERRIWGAGLDVYEEEPTVHPGLLSLPHTVLLPHIGSATYATRTRMGLIAVDNLIAFFTGKRPPNLVNEKVWK